MSMPTINPRWLSQNVLSLKVTIASVSVMLMTGCQTLPNSAQMTSKNDNVVSNLLTASMPAMDRSGRIAYVEEQGMGAKKISSLYSIRPDGSARQLIDQLNGYIYAPAWSPNGQYLAYSKQAPLQHPKIYIYDISSNSINMVVNSEGSNLSASFSPDGQKLLYSSTVGGNADIYEMRLSDGNTRQLTTLLSTEVQPSYASDGNSFVYVSDKVRAGSPRIYRYTFANEQAVPIPTSGYVASPQLSRDGKRLAYLNGRQAAVMTLATGQVTNLAETGLDEPARLSPSGQYVIYPMQNRQINGRPGSSLVIRALGGGHSYVIGTEAGTEAGTESGTGAGAVLRSPVWGR